MATWTPNQRHYQRGSMQTVDGNFFSFISLSSCSPRNRWSFSSEFPPNASKMCITRAKNYIRAALAFSWALCRFFPCQKFQYKNRNRAKLRAREAKKFNFNLHGNFPTTFLCCHQELSSLYACFSALMNIILDYSNRLLCPGDVMTSKPSGGKKFSVKKCGRKCLLYDCGEIAIRNFSSPRHVCKHPCQPFHIDNNRHGTRELTEAGAGAKPKSNQNIHIPCLRFINYVIASHLNVCLFSQRFEKYFHERKTFSRRACCEHLTRGRISRSEIIIRNHQSPRWRKTLRCFGENSPMLRCDAVQCDAMVEHWWDHRNPDVIVCLNL